MVRRRSLSSMVMLVALTAGGVSCGVRAPAPLDVTRLVRDRGPVEARRALEIRILDAPRDVQARLALARLADEAGRPAQALDQLEAVLRLGGPIGTRWHDDDRARMARLLAARGRARLGRGAATALDDLERARGFGAPVAPDELARAHAEVAVAQLRHVDPEERERGRRILVGLIGSPIADASWLGAKPSPVPRDRGLYGIWLWQHGARRAAFEALQSWSERTSVRGEPIHAAYLRARAWWTPADAPPPASELLIGPERCAFPAAPGCAPAALIAEATHEPAAVIALLRAPLARTADPADASAWASITLWEALRGAAAWGPALAARVDLSALDLAALPPHVQPVFARLVGRPAASVSDQSLAKLRPHERVVVAASRVLDGASAAQVRVALGSLADGAEGAALLHMIDPPVADAPASPYTSALGAYVRARGHELPALARVVAAYAREPVIADRLAREVVAAATDAAATQAALGALFEALDDPARARQAWQAAVDLAAEPALLQGLARALARANDPDAALIQGVRAAAASGDPAEAWIDLGRALEGVGKHVHALEAARSALDLAGPEALASALDLAIAASRGLGRTGQVEALATRRARIGPVAGARSDDDPTDAAAALASYRRYATVSTIARLWVASRWNPRDVAIRAALLAAIAPDDPRRRVLVVELVALAADRDPHLGRAAVAALR